MSITINISHNILPILREFDGLWKKYCNAYIDLHKIQEYSDIIFKIRNKETDFTDEKETFINFINDIEMTIYFCKNYNEIYDDTNIAYSNDRELICCRKIKKYLQSL